MIAIFLHRLKKRQHSSDVLTDAKTLNHSESTPDITKARHSSSLKNADRKRAEYKIGGPMPDDVRDMIGNLPETSPKRKTASGATPKIKIIKSPQRSPKKISNNLTAGMYNTNLLSPDMTPKRKKIKKEKKRQQLTSNEPYTLNDKFEEEKKRNIIGEFLKNPKPELSDLILEPKSPTKTKPKLGTETEKAKVVIGALEEAIEKKKEGPKTDTVGVISKEKQEIQKQVEKPKVNLFNVVVASAAAEVVNLKSKGKIII